LHGHLTWRTGVRAVITRGTRFIRTHSPTFIDSARSDGDQPGIRGKFAFYGLLDERFLHPAVAVDMVVCMMVVVSCFGAGEEAEERKCARGRHVESHGGSLRFSGIYTLFGLYSWAMRKADGIDRDQPNRNERKTKVSKKAQQQAQKPKTKETTESKREKKRNIKTSTRKKLKKKGTSPPTKPP